MQGFEAAKIPRAQGSRSGASPGATDEIQAKQKPKHKKGQQKAAPSRGQPLILLLCVLYLVPGRPNLISGTGACPPEPEPLAWDISAAPKLSSVQVSRDGETSRQQGVSEILKLDANPRTLVLNACMCIYW